MESGGIVMFMGTYWHNLDSKNRLIVPAKFREELGDTFIVTKGLDGCLSVYTQHGWNKFFAKLEAAPKTKREVRNYIRGFTSKATECQIDSQGRIQLPPFLLQEGNLEKECVVVGANDIVEIWSKERWEEMDEMINEGFETFIESVTEYL